MLLVQTLVQASVGWVPAPCQPCLPAPLSQGIEAWRVDLLPLAASNAEHLAMYALMDISLDTFPYAGPPCPAP